MKTSIYYILIGIGLVTIIDTVGSIVSRKLNFNYAYFSVLSLAAYIFTAYSISQKTDTISPALISVILVGVYDATVGWVISQKLGAHYGQWKEMAARMTLEQRLFSSLIFSLLCGFSGHFMAG